MLNILQILLVLSGFVNFFTAIFSKSKVLKNVFLYLNAILLFLTVFVAMFGQYLGI